MHTLPKTPLMFLAAGCGLLAALVGAALLPRLTESDQLPPVGAAPLQASMVKPVSIAATAPPPPPGVPERFRGRIFTGAALPDDQKVVALTFDDGPMPGATPQILEILRREQVPATFFCVGAMIAEHPELLRAVAADGHVIANHTWSHSYRRLGPAAAAAEVKRTSDLIYRTTGRRDTLFRPPGGILSNGPARQAARQGYALVLWTVVSGDTFRGVTGPRMVERVVRQVQPGGVVLMHDGGGRHPTVGALNAIIVGLRKRGYRFVTVPELLALEEERLPAAQVGTATRNLVAAALSESAGRRSQPALPDVRGRLKDAGR